jgi:ABC-2 type transport system ATP-binding protein
MRSAVPQRYVDLHVRGPMPDWALLPAVEVLAAVDGHARLRLDRGADVQAIIAYAQVSGELISFAYQPPTLSDLFREAVAA